LSSRKYFLTNYATIDLSPLHKKYAASQKVRIVSKFSEKSLI
jgi:hypothetical protein